MTRSARAVILALVLLSGTVVFAGISSANPASPECGDVVVSSLKLQQNLNCTQGTGGLVFGADNIEINLNGFAISGDCVLVNDAVGIRTDGHSGVKITGPGTIQCFDAGIVIEGLPRPPESLDAGSPQVALSEPDQSKRPSRCRDSVCPPKKVDPRNLTVGGNNKVEGVSLKDNKGDPDGDFGDGVLVAGSSNNKIEKNTITGNGPWDGVGIIGLVAAAPTPANFNKIENNFIADNSVPTGEAGHHGVTNQDMGVRVEPGTQSNIVKENTVTGNGLEGIRVFGQSNANVVEKNYVANNGNHIQAHRKGDGIRVDGPTVNNVVSSNTVCSNAANGIVMSRSVNKILGNKVGVGTVGCAANNTSSSSVAFDLNDLGMTATTPWVPGTPCGVNEWKGNFTQGDTYNHLCTTQ